MLESINAGCNQNVPSSEREERKYWLNENENRREIM
jgi:hypothetical protein